jgi:hypothetical protein
VEWEQLLGNLLLAGQLDKMLKKIGIIDSQKKPHRMILEAMPS